MLVQDVFDIFATHASLVYDVVDHFSIALFSALKQTLLSHVILNE